MRRSPRGSFGLRESAYGVFVVTRPYPNLCRSWGRSARSWRCSKMARTSRGVRRRGSEVMAMSSLMAVSPTGSVGTEGDGRSRQGDCCESRRPSRRARHQSRRLDLADPSAKRRELRARFPAGRNAERGRAERGRRRTPEGAPFRTASFSPTVPSCGAYSCSPAPLWLLSYRGISKEMVLLSFDRLLSQTTSPLFVFFGRRGASEENELNSFFSCPATHPARPPRTASCPWAAPASQCHNYVGAVEMRERKGVQ